MKKSLELEWDDAKAEEAGALLEVLSHSQGMEADSDYVEQFAIMPLREPKVLFASIETWIKQGTIIAPQMNEQQTAFSCMIVEQLPNLIETGNTYAKSLATMLVAENRVELTGNSMENLNKIVEKFRQDLGLAIGEAEFGTMAAPDWRHWQGSDRLSNEGHRPRPCRGQGERRGSRHYYENVWAHKPLKALNGVAPIDAAGSKQLRKRLLGVIKFHDEALAGYVPRDEAGKAQGDSLYDFNRLRHKLGAELQAPGDAPTINVPVEAKVEAKKDFTAMSAADLAQLDADSLSINELEEALRSALKLDARDLAVRFAEVAVAKPPTTEKPDRYTFFAPVSSQQRWPRRTLPKR